MEYAGAGLEEGGVSQWRMASDDLRVMDDFRDYKITASHVCPCCGEKLTGALNVTGDGPPRTDPNHQSLSVCFYCLAFLEFTKDQTLSPLSAEDLAALPSEMQFDLHRVKQAIVAGKFLYPDL
jgi:hypothetical protein